MIPVPYCVVLVEQSNTHEVVVGFGAVEVVGVGVGKGGLYGVFV